ncbi:retrovirus-related pol polyprotein from transposon TNT 1-94 [Tanacetum coccineum]
MYKLDLVILAPKVKNNREAHEYYLKYTMEQDAILRELLGYVRDTCPNIHKPSKKLVVVTPINKKKTVRFAETSASSSNIPKVTNRVKPSTSASGSKPSGNTKNDRISQTPSSNEKNKVEVQSRKVKSKLNKQNSDSKNVCNEHVKHPVKGAQALCSVCNECLFDANPVMCLIDHVDSMNARDKSASKKNKKRKEWKPTRKVFNFVGYKQKPTGRTFTLVGNACPLTRITATNKVPFRVPIPLKVVTPEHVVTRVYTRRPKVPKSVPNSKPKVVQIVLWYLDSDCSEHMTGDRSQLTNFVYKFLGIVKWCKGKSYILVIVDDYSQFTSVKFLASKDEAPDFIIKFLKMIQVRLNAPVRNIHTDNGTRFVNQTFRDYYEQVGISHETSIAQTPQQNGVVERRNRTLVIAAQTMLIYAKAPLFLWAEAVATACYTQNRSLTAMASEQSSLEPALHEMTPATPNSGLIPNPPPSVPFVPPLRHEWDLVFQPVFDEFFFPPASVAFSVPVEEAPAPVKSTNSPSSTTVDQDAPSPSTSQTTPQSQSQTIPLSAKEESNDLEVAYMSNDPYFGIPIPETISKESSSSNIISTTVHLDSPISEHLSR